jgi:serine/threonine protein kinase
MEIREGAAFGPFILEKEIGRGSFASVWLGYHSVSKIKVAIKVIEKDSINTAIARTRLQRETALLKTVEHPCIAGFFEVIDSYDYVILIMEYVEKGNLFDYMSAHGKFSETQARKYFSQLIAALEYLHVVMKIAHRDLKCENILIDRNYNIRVIDFGLSNFFSEYGPKMQTSCGSPAYAAPEMLKGGSYTQATDIWSAGILLYTLCAGELPFRDETMQNLLQRIISGEITYPSDFSLSFVDLLRKMTWKEPSSRITIDEIKAHPWFSQAEYVNIVIQNDEVQRARSGEAGIDKSVVNTMTEMGVDCRGLVQGLLGNEFTDTTALYRILVREKLTERMKEVVATCRSGFLFPDKDQSEGPNKLVELQPCLHRSSAHLRATDGPGAFPSVKIGNVIGREQTQLRPIAAGGTMKAERQLCFSGIQAMRRFSRPLIVKKPIQIPTTDG